MKTTIVTPHAPPAIGAYAQATAMQGFLFCSGQIALRPDGTLTQGTISDEVVQIMKNLRAILLQGGATFDDVVQTTIYLTNIDDFSVVNDVYATEMGAIEAWPSRVTVAVSALPKGARVEISMIARAPSAYSTASTQQSLPATLDA